MNGDRELACSHSLEWLQALDKGHRRQESRNLLRLAQTMASIFEKNQFIDKQQQLIDES
jgi:hypothetical protein